MTIHSIVIQKLLSTNAHLGRRVAAHHFKVYICGSRNGIAILDSDKTLICLRNACHFIGSPIRQKGRSFFVNTNSLFDEIIEQMATRIGCINDSQWRIGGFLTNCSSPKKIRSRNKKINFGSNQQPDCVVIFDADRKSSVILEADRLQIPIASLVDSNIPLGSYKRITYPIPANDPIQFVYLFRNSITKTVLLERGRIVAMKETVGEEKAHRPELLQALLDKGGLTNERKMELVPHPGIKPHFLATNQFRRPFIREFRSTPYYSSPLELFEAVAPFLNAVSTWAGSSMANGVSGVTDGNVGANSLPGAEVIPSSGTTSTGIPPLLSLQIPKGGHGHLASLFFLIKTWCPTGLLCLNKAEKWSRPNRKLTTPVPLLREHPLLITVLKKGGSRAREPV
ncbi:ribosomal protein S2, mitochondrial [Telopea speciosissima]|uniref:ribosomal protein S2, mitochondrial n=1 Tax=Telopea speciosissima TaxID=54955 RepID=UPI001CC66600|nr:ribosomal protein S2, mitochondrial [Telopea speciosissima]